MRRHPGDALCLSLLGPRAPEALARIRLEHAERDDVVLVVDVPDYVSLARRDRVLRQVRRPPGLAPSVVAARLELPLGQEDVHLVSCQTASSAIIPLRVVQRPGAGSRSGSTSSRTGTIRLAITMPTTPRPADSSTKPLARTPAAAASDVKRSVAPSAVPRSSAVVRSETTAVAPR